MLRKLKAVILSAILLSLSFSTFNLWFLAWFGFIPLFFALKDTTLPKAFVLTFLCGVIFWAGTIYWLVNVTLIGTVILILYLSLYFGVFGVLATFFRRYSSQAAQVLIVPALWVCLEYARSHLLTGFPWALLGYSQYKFLPIIQVSDITGAWGVSFLVMAANVSLAYFFSRRQKSITQVFLCASILILSLAYGFLRLHLEHVASATESVKVSVVQGNIPQELKWDASAKAFILDSYLRLSKNASKSSPDLIIWPEASSPAVSGDDDWIYDDIKGLAQDIKTPFIIGAVTRNNQDFFNSALLINASGVVEDSYSKLHLVPFGEYIPLKKALPFLATIVPIGDISRGNRYTVFRLQSSGVKQQANNFSVLICFEDLFPELSRQFVKMGAGFLICITNDAWYKQTSAPWQHLQASVFRAVENRVFMARSANTGISGFIAPTGEIYSMIKDSSARETFIEGVSTRVISTLRDRRLSVYTVYGDFFPVACLIFILYGIMRVCLVRQRSRMKHST